MEAPFASHTRTPAELRAQIEAERAGAPFLIWRAGDGAQRILRLDAGRLTIGRDRGCDVALAHDEEVSRLHAERERVGAHWVLADHGLSTNGTFLNGERLHGEKALHDGDTVRVGATQMLFRAPPAEALTPMQRAVLLALCRPFKDASPFATPASNQQIADEVALSVPRVKAHLTDLFERFGVDDLPHNVKRLKLAEEAIRTRAVSPREF